MKVGKEARWWEITQDERQQAWFNSYAYGKITYVYRTRTFQLSEDTRSRAPFAQASVAMLTF